MILSRKRKMTIDHEGIQPKRAHAHDAGIDLFTPKNFIIRAHGAIVIDTGVHILLKPGEVGFVKSKSGLLSKYGIWTDGTVDAGYTGPICVMLNNDGNSDVHFHRGDKIAQLVVCPVTYIEPELVDSMPKTKRGGNGFGSTGR